MPAVSARNRTAPPTAAARRGSESICNSMRLGSVVTGLRESDVTCFPAIRAVVQAVHAEMHFVQTFADGAVFLAGALIFRFVALHAKDGTVGHQVSPKRLYLRAKRRGKTGVPRIAARFPRPGGGRL